VDADKEQIAEVLIRYATGIDSKDWPLLRDRATARSYVQAVLMLQPNDSTNWVDALGHYDDVFVRTPDGWRIKERVSRTARTLTGGDIAAAATKGRI
jgi:hypothetical protein